MKSLNDIVKESSESTQKYSKDTGKMTGEDVRKIFLQEAPANNEYLGIWFDAFLETALTAFDDKKYRDTPEEDRKIVLASLQKYLDNNK